MFYTARMKFKDAISSTLKASMKEAIKNAPTQTSVQSETDTAITGNNSSQSKENLKENNFKKAVGKVKPMVQDSFHSVRKIIKQRNSATDKKNSINKMALSTFHFSDEFEPELNQQGPMKYVRDDVDTFEVKNLRRGFYKPDLILDLHGLDQNQAKKELSALLFACQKEHAQCICIIHGIGAYVLKNKVPHWLVQHPDIMAFHQAPLEWGGKGAILALVELKDKFNRD